MSQLSRFFFENRRYESLLVDLKHVCRRLGRSPGFAITVVLTLAIGIGANTAVFSVLNSVLLRPLPYPEPQQLVSLHLNAPGAPGLAEFRSELRLSASMYLTFATHNRTFQSVGVWGPGTASITGLAQPEQVNTAQISGGVLETLNVPAFAWPMAYGGRSGRPWTGAGDVELRLLAAPLRRRPWRRRTHHQRQFPVARDRRGDAARIQGCELRLRSAGSDGFRSDK